jgi:GNAT superfamily N-acetyltransferase
VNVRRAQLADAAVAAEILDEATAYVSTLGFEQWPVPFPQDELAHRIERGELYMVDVDGEPAATLTLLWDDPAFWGNRPPDAVYLHKLAVRRAFAGRGLGSAIVEWVDEHAASAGREFVRLDCQRDDAGIRTYYERLGFEHRGDKEDDPRFAVALYERRTRPLQPRPFQPGPVPGTGPGLGSRGPAGTGTQAPRPVPGTTDG